jgi:hypothetical protein
MCGIQIGDKKRAGTGSGRRLADAAYIAVFDNRGGYNYRTIVDPKTEKSDPGKATRRYLEADE